MYQPGGVMFGFCGIFAVTTPFARPVISRLTNRWLPSKECVVTQFLIRLTHRMFADCGDVI